MSAERVVRHAAGAGRWFPADPGILRRTVEGYVEAARPPAVAGRIVGALAPHAGYIYSGAVAGFTFRALRDNAAAAGAPETVVVLGFSHRGAFPGLAVLEGDAFATPLGELPLDREGAALLAGRPRAAFDARAHAGEHSAENELPFLQEALPGVPAVVALLGDHDARTIDAAVQGLADLAARRRITVVASTDMLHDPDYERVARTDRATLRRVEALDAAGLARDWAPERQVFCGIGPVLAVLRHAAAQGCARGAVLRYRNSGDDFPESRGEWVVGYGAAVFAA